MMRRSCLYTAIFLISVFAVQLFAQKASMLVQNDNERRGHPGLWLCHYPSGDITTIRDYMILWAALSPDGRKVCYANNGNLYITNNNGTGEEEVVTGGGFHEAFQIFWTTNGIFWINDKDHTMYRYDVAADKKTTVLDMTTLGSICEMGGGWDCSADGHRMWLKEGFDPPDIDSLYCGVRGYTRGAHPYIHWNNDFSSFDAIWRSEWGHGNTMSKDGYLFLVRLGQHTDLWVTRQTGTTLETVYDKYSLIPAYTEEARNICGSINNDSIMGANWLHEADNNTNKLIFWNWRTKEMGGQFPHPCANCADADNRLKVRTVWYGDLPKLDGPFLAASPTELIYQAGDVGPKTITVTNDGTGTLTAVTASENADWLSASVSGSGNSQTVSVTVSPANLPQASNTADITISGGGAGNSIKVTVTAYKAGALPAPSELAAVVAGSDENDVKLTWKDNSADETGFKIYRKAKDGTYAEIKSVSADVNSYTDAGVSYPETFYYTVKAVKDATESNASNEVNIQVNGALWIKVLTPVAGSTLKPGQAYKITWEENRITNVKVEFSKDGGLTWDVVTAQGGLVKSTSGWGDYFSWEVPDGWETEDGIIKVAQYDDAADGQVKVRVSSSQASVAFDKAEDSRCDFISQGRSGRIVINAPVGSNAYAGIYDVHGKLVLKRNVAAGGRLDVNLGEMPGGYYFVTVRDKENRDLVHRKLVMFR